MSESDPLEDFESGLPPMTQKRLLTMKLAQEILADPLMSNSSAVVLFDLITLTEYLLNGQPDS